MLPGSTLLQKKDRHPPVEDRRIDTIKASNLHRSSGRWKYGLALSLMAAFFWGLLPIALKHVLDSMDPFTLTWYRFLIAAVILGVYVVARRKLGAVRSLRGTTLRLFVVGCVLVAANYVIYVLGLEELTPGTAQVVIQLAPIFMLFGGLILFKEAFSRVQWLGLAVFVTGLGLFFNERLGELFSQLSDYTVGVLLIVLAGAVWAAYAMAQKQLLRTFSSDTIMFLFYVGGVVLLLPFAHPGQVGGLDTMSVIMLLFCALNTLVAYGCFVEALNHWEASRISAVLATTPLFTFVVLEFGAPLVPSVIRPEPLNALSAIGAILVVGGSMLSALGRKAKRSRAPTKTSEKS